MEVKLQLSVVLLLLQGSLAMRTQVTLMKGETLRLRCPISNAHRSPVEWKNPEGFVMFFNQNKALKDKRYSITKLSESRFSISVSNISFKDGGNYTCTHYGHPPIERKVKVTVIGGPLLSVTRHEGKFWIKCSAQANASPPLLSWKVDDGTEFSTAGTLSQQKQKKYGTESLISLQSLPGRVTVHCLLRHPALNSQPLMNFVNVGRDPERCGLAASSSAASTPPHSSTGPPAEGGETGAPTSDPASTQPPTPTRPSEPSLDPQHLSTRGWASESETTEDIPSSNSTKGNHTGILSSDQQIGVRRNSRLLVFLVTCLIAGLLVVVLFLAIKLRKAHVAWRRENDESVPSEESSKSKTSQEEKNIQRRRGLYNTTLAAQYVVQEPTVLVPEVDAAAQTVTDSGNQHLSSHPEPVAQITTRLDVKETSL